MSSETEGGSSADPCAVARSATRPASAGAQPSITAPANSIRVLRHGIDSLYISYAGEVDVEFALKLQRLKELAQGLTDQEVSQAFCDLGDHRLTVAPRGRGRFAYVLEDNWFSIQVSNARALPLAHVQVRSEFLTAVGAEEALRSLDRLVKEFGELRGDATISRVDLYADFTTNHNLTGEPGRAWIKRCRKRDIHEEGDRVTGISFGPGNELSARLYDKTLEITKSGKDYLKPLWAAKGWQEGETVWRMEFQSRREAFAPAMKGVAIQTVPHLGLWWRYLATEWLRLVVPSDSDETRMRWPTHPVWNEIAGVWDVPPDVPPMRRVTKTRAPTDDAIFKNGFWGLSSFMAREGIEDLVEGMEGFLRALKRYHGRFPQSEGLHAYMDRKRRLKERRYNTPSRDHDKE